jgi:DNA-binding transcriptional MerR regulator
VSVDPDFPGPRFATRLGGTTAVSRSGRHDVAAWGVTIGELCSLFSLTPRAIRFYEERGLVTATRDARNRRVFDRRARRRLQVIADLRRGGLPLDEIGELLDAAGDDEIRLRQQALAKLAAQLQALDATREDLVQLMGYFARQTTDRRLSRSQQ